MFMPSSPEPAAHSPVAVPEAVSVLAAVMASLRVHSPSVPSASSAVLLTVMIAACAGLASTTIITLAAMAASISSASGLIK